MTVSTQPALTWGPRMLRFLTDVAVTNVLLPMCVLKASVRVGMLLCVQVAGLVRGPVGKPVRRDRAGVFRHPCMSTPVKG